MKYISNPGVKKAFGDVTGNTSIFDVGDGELALGSELVVEALEGNEDGDISASDNVDDVFSLGLEMVVPTLDEDEGLKLPGPLLDGPL
ncbi:hypothetical protein VNO78_14620 [Psophocarpus tetragonolobus]|uniref:Uncharacterized protein n=1 Tax=Psophocarpus tetragonolobus TaxID=3891 RepID=A0AAN9SDS6_PSOTE